MKHRKNLIALIALLIAIAVSRATEVDWHTFTGGGGISQHGAVALGGAFGPSAPALSPATGGDYTLTGGFWPAFPGQPQPASPVLTIRSIDNGEKVRLSWPIGLIGFKLEYTSNPGSGNWLPEYTEVVKTTTEHIVTVPTATSYRCYRLCSN